MVTAILASRYSLKPVVIRSRAKGHNLGLPVIATHGESGAALKVLVGRATARLSSGCLARRSADEGAQHRIQPRPSRAASG